MRAVFDASALIPLMVPEDTTVNARRVWAEATERLCLDLTMIEAANVLWRLQRSKRLETEHLPRFLEELVGWPLEVVSSVDFVPEACALAVRLDHPVYDCLYAVAARACNAALVTADFAFIRKLGRTGLTVIPVDTRPN